MPEDAHGRILFFNHIQEKGMSDDVYSSMRSSGASNFITEMKSAVT